MTYVCTGRYALNFTAEPPSNANKTSVANTTAHATLARDLARASIVLLKNDAGALPLGDAASLPRGVAVIGLDALNGGGGSGQVQPPYTVSTVDGLQAAIPGLNVTYYNGNNICKSESAPNCRSASMHARSFSAVASSLAAAVDAVILIVSVWGSEGMDRANLSLGCAPWAGTRSCEWW